MLWALAFILRSDEGLTLDTSAQISQQWLIYIYQLGW